MNNLIKIKENSSFKGVYSGLGNIEICGIFEGVLITNTVYIKKTGMFIGKLAAEKVIVEGEINADIEVETLHLKKTGLVDGDLIYRDLIIESGGLLNSNRVHNMSKSNDLIKSINNN